MLRIYRWLLKLYPAAFREEYAGLMEQEVRNELAETSAGAAVLWLWLRLLFDLAVSIPSQFAIEIWRDSKHSLRLWAKRPWQTGFAVVALAVAIGANTGVFSVVNALLLRSLPFRNPDQLAALVHFMPPHDSANQFEEWRTHSRYLEDAAVFEQGDFNIGSADHVMRAHIAQTSWNFFSLLGIQPVIGRAFTSRDQGVALVSYGLWQELFTGNEHVLGSTIRVNGKPITIVGVLPPDFGYPGKTVLWKSAEFSRGNNGWRTIGRLKANVNWAQARAALAADMLRLEPDRKFVADWIPAIIPLRDELSGRVKKASLLLMAGVMLILLIACANLANFMLARTADRQHELSIRSALGASRARLIQQLLTECFLLALVSAALGLVVAFWATSAAAKVQPATLPSQTYSILDFRVMAFMAGVAMLSAMLFGILPAMSVGKVHSFAARGSTELRSSWFVRHLLVAAQVMLTVVLLTASVSVVRAFSHALHVDHGFKTDGLVTVSVSLDGTTRASAAQQLEYIEATLARVRRLPGVRYASATQFLPLDATGFIGGPYAVDGHPSKPGTGTDIIPIMSDYFAATSGDIRYGRDFTDAEVRSDANVTIVNDTFAKLALGTTDVLGRMVTDAGNRTRKIIGVVKSVDFMDQWISDIFDVNPPEVFVPEHSPTDFPSTFVVHVDGRPEDHLAMIRDVIQSVDRTVPVFGVKTMQQRMDEAFARPKLYRTAMLFFAAFALLLAVIGIYAVVSYAVAQRTHEMGVRLALGTTPTRLRKRLLGQGLISVIFGTLCGSAGAMLAGRLLGSLIEGAGSFDPMTYVAATLFICLIASLSIWTATDGISRMDVIEILRAE
jgi:putative ABC transport system permease protein